MKRFAAPLMVLGALLSLTVGADPLAPARVPAGTKWLLHLDADQFRRTKVGDYFFREILEKKSAKGREDLKQWLDFDLDWSQVHSITAFGTSYQPKVDQTGLLLVHTSMDIAKALETAIDRNSPGFRPRKVEEGPNPIYRINKDAFVCAGENGWFLLGKSREALTSGRATLAGEGPGLTGAGLLKGYGAPGNSFFLIGLADELGQNATLPLNAAILKQAEGGRLVIGEKGDRLFADLAIRTKTPEVAQQIQQILQGLIALGTLSQEQKPELQEIVQSARVSAAEQSVTIGVQLPVARAIEKIAERK